MLIKILEEIKAPSITLYEFLRKERKKSKAHDNQEREVKWTLSFNDKYFGDDIENLEREFLIKTRHVPNRSSCDASNSSFLHIFTDTTHITQFEEVKAQNKYQRTMLANVSHEFRTPLNAISMSLILLKDQLEEKDSKFLKIATSSWDILASLVEDILDHAKIESGVFEVNDVKFELNQLLDEVQSIFELQWNRKEIGLLVNLDPQLDKLLIWSDKQRLKQVILNLCSNALKFTDTGCIRINLFIDEARHEDFSMRNFSHTKQCPLNESDECVEDEFSPKHLKPKLMHFFPNKSKNNNCDDGLIKEKSKSGEIGNRTTRVCLWITDTGIGIPKKDLSSLFKLFGKTSSNHRRNKTGCGLGLTICKMIIEKLGGHIKLESEEGVGTKVKWWFKIRY